MRCSSNESTSGKLVLTCRYLKQLKPPAIFATDSFAMVDLMMKLAHFVSLIPILPDCSPSCVTDNSSVGLPTVIDIWTKCDEFLTFLLGTCDQHAILLCNYFLYLGRLAALVTELGVPEGSTIYVIVWEYNRHGHVEITLWNARSGQPYSPHDPFIPLTSVFSIIMSDNVSYLVARDMCTSHSPFLFFHFCPQIYVNVQANSPNCVIRIA